VRLTSVSQRQALGHHRMDFTAPKQLEQNGEVLSEPILVTDAQFLNSVGKYPPARRQQTPYGNSGGSQVPLEYARPILAALRRNRVLPAVDDKPAARPQRAEGAQPQRATKRVEHDVHTVAGELAYLGQEVFVAIVDGHRAEAVKQIGAAIHALHAAGMQVLATTVDGEARLDEVGLAAPTAWLFGPESHGLSAEIADQADHRVRIPMSGGAESLNVAAAAAICLYQSAQALDVLQRS